MALASPVLGPRHAEHRGARASHSLRSPQSWDAPAPLSIRVSPSRHRNRLRKSRQLLAARGCSPDDADTSLGPQYPGTFADNSGVATAPEALSQPEGATERSNATGLPGAGATREGKAKTGRRRGEAPQKWVEERGVQAQIQGSFYRAESAVSRDLGALAAYLYGRGELPHQQRVAAREREREARREKHRGREKETLSRPPHNSEGHPSGPRGDASTEGTTGSQHSPVQDSTDAGTEAAGIAGTVAPGLRVLDVMSGSGIRGARYLLHAGADFVWCNDASVDCHPALRHNLSAASSPASSSTSPSSPSSSPSSSSSSSSSASSSPPPQSPSPLPWWSHGEQDVDSRSQPAGTQTHGEGEEGAEGRVEEEGGEGGVEEEGGPLRGDAKWRKDREGKSGLEGAKWRITHEDALRVLYLCYQRKDFFDVIDLDSFGGDTSCLGPALGATCNKGGLLYATSTDGFSTGGHAPLRSLASFGAYVRGPIPWCNELGMRMLIGAAVREAATRGLQVRPLFSLYSFHGPVFRCMLQVSSSAYAAASAPPEDAAGAPAPPEGRQQLAEQYGFIGFCKSCRESRVLRWDSLGSGCLCDSPRCTAASAPPEPSVADSPSSGPFPSERSTGKPGDPSSLATETSLTPTTTEREPQQERHAASGSVGCAEAGPTGGGREAAPGGTPTDANPQTDGVPLPQDTGAATGTGGGAPEALAGGEQTARRQGAAVHRGKPMLVVGPVWTGPLHCQQTVGALAAEAERRGWGAAERTLKLMQGEADPALPPWFIRLDEVAKGAKAKTPPLPKFLQLLNENGYAAARSHVDLRAIKTDCPFHECVALLQTMTQ